MPDAVLETPTPDIIKPASKDSESTSPDRPSIPLTTVIAPKEEPNPDLLKVSQVGEINDRTLQDLKSLNTMTESVVHPTGTPSPGSPGIPIPPSNIMTSEGSGDMKNIITIDKDANTTVDKKALDGLAPQENPAAPVVTPEVQKPEMVLPVQPVEGNNIVAAADEARKDAQLALDEARKSLQSEVKADLTGEEKFKIRETVNSKDRNAQVKQNVDDGRAPVGEAPSDMASRAPAEKPGFWSKIKKLLHVQEMPQGVPSIEAYKQNIDPTLGQAEPVRIDEVDPQNPHLPSVDSAPGSQGAPDIAFQPNRTPNDNIPSDTISKESTPSEPKLDTGGPDGGNPEPDEPNGKPDQGKPTELKDIIADLPSQESLVIPNVPAIPHNAIPTPEPPPLPGPMPAATPRTSGGNEAPNNLNMSEVKFGAADIAGSVNPVLDNDKIAEMKVKAQEAAKASSDIPPPDNRLK